MMVCFCLGLGRFFMSSGLGRKLFYLQNGQKSNLKRDWRQMQVIALLIF